MIILADETEAPESESANIPITEDQLKAIKEEIDGLKLRDGVSEIGNFLTILRILVRDFKPAFEKGNFEEAVFFLESCKQINFPFERDVYQSLIELEVCCDCDLLSGAETRYNKLLHTCLFVLQRNNEFYGLKIQYDKI